MARQRLRLHPLPLADVRADALAPSALERTLRPDDQEALAPLLWQAYRGTVDDTGESEADAMVEIQRLFSGAYGELLMDASRVVALGSQLLSASLITRFDGAPLLAFSLTLPAWQRRGLAGTLIRSSCAALARAGERELNLVVTMGNVAAERLYARLGFVAAPEQPAR